VLDALIPEHGENWLNIESIRGRVQVNISDMRDLHSLNELVKGKGFIFNLAGQVSHGDSMRDPHLDLPANCISSMNLVESCRKKQTHSTTHLHIDPAGLWRTDVSSGNRGTPGNVM
jgi:UDP-glucose 4-epimerase